MIAIDPPFRLRVLASILTLLVPVAVTQWVLASGAPWWRLDFQSLVLPAAMAAGPVAVVRIGLLRGSRPVLVLGQVLAALWVAGSFLLSIEDGSLAQALLGTLLAGFFYVVFTLIGSVFDGPSYDSGLRWFEGMPRLVPGASSVLNLGKDGDAALKLSRMDERGAFFVAEASGILEGLLLRPGTLDGIISFGSEQAPFRARLVSAARHPAKSARNDRLLGIGVEFSDMSADARKVLGDLLERMRSHGCLDREDDPAVH